MASCAILLAGTDAGCDDDHAVYANDLALWTDVLVRRLGVERGRIAVHFGRGGPVRTTQPNGRLATVPATRAAIGEAFAKAATELRDDDLFVLIASNHGQRAPDARVVLWPTDGLSPDELRALCDGLPSRRQVYVLGQCGAGAFGAVAGPGRAVLAACRGDQGTWCRKDDARGRTFQWSEFLFHLAEGLGGDSTGQPPCATLEEAFTRARGMSSHPRADADGEVPEIHDPDRIARTIVPH